MSIQERTYLNFGRYLNSQRDIKSIFLDTNQYDSHIFQTSNWNIHSNKCECICGVNGIGYLKFIYFLKVQITIAMNNM